MANATLNEKFIPDLRLAVILYDPNNPRKHFDEVKLSELAASIGKHGVVEPIVARPHPTLKDKFMIVAGERRHRASVLAKLATIPAIVRDYSEQEAAEVQQIENLQRADIHPMDEAHGFARLVKEFKYTPESIGDKIGKTAGYVARRMALVKLKDSLQKAFWKEKLPLAHAEYLCRLSDYDQAYLEKMIWQPYNDNAVVALARVKSEAERQLFMDLARVPWKQTDDFVRGVPTCQECPQRTGCAKLLFPEYDKTPNVCTNRECFDMKMAAYVDMKLIASPKLVMISGEWNEKKEKDVLVAGTYKLLDHKKDKCESEQSAIFVDGNRAGHPARICADKKCPKHHGEIFRNAHDGRQSADASRQQREWRIESQSRAMMFTEAFKVNTTKIKLDLEDLRMITQMAWDRAMYRDKVAKAIGWERASSKGEHRSYHAVAAAYIAKANQPELIRLTMLLTCNGDIDKGYTSKPPSDLAAVGKRWGIDVLKIRSKTRSELEAKYKAKTKKKAVKP